MTTPAVIPTESVVEYVLRSGGFYRTPPPLSGCVLAVPSLIPEIGALIGAITYVPAPVSGSMSYAPSKDTFFTLAADPGAVITVGSTLVTEGWFRGSGGFSFEAPSPVRLWVEVWGTTIQFTFSPGPTINSGVTFPSDTAFHYVYTELSFTSTGATWFVQVDSASASGTYSGGRLPSINLGTTNVYSTFEGVSVRVVPTSTLSRVVRNTWSPNFATVWTGATPGLVATIDTTASAWEIIRQMADSTGSQFRWSEAGAFLWSGPTAVRDSRFTTPAAIIDATKLLIASGFGYEGASRRSQVGTSWQDVAVADALSIDKSLWQATDVITVPRNSRQTMDVATDNQVVVLAYMPPSPTPPTDHVSSYGVVRAYQVGDPAAFPITSGVSIRLDIASGGFRATIINSNSFDIALWDAATQAPHFIVRGSYLTSTGARNFTAKSSAKSKESLTLGENPWRQDAAAAIAQAEAIAAETALPAIVFSQQNTVGDPTRTVGDVINLQAATLMDAPVPCIIIGKDSTMDEDTLTVVPCYPPTGWVLGVTGRSELATTTLASTTILVA